MMWHFLADSRPGPRTASHWHCEAARPWPSSKSSSARFPVRSSSIHTVTHRETSSSTTTHSGSCEYWNWNRTLGASGEYSSSTRSPPPAKHESRFQPVARGANNTRDWGALASWLEVLKRPGRVFSQLRGWLKTVRTSSQLQTSPRPSSQLRAEAGTQAVSQLRAEAGTQAVSQLRPPVSCVHQSAAR